VRKSAASRTISSGLTKVDIPAARARLQRLVNNREIKMGQMAVMASESAPGEFRFSLLGSVSRPTGLLSFRPFVSDQTAHSSEMEAWIAGACAVADYLVRPIAPEGTGAS
jgi:hypothetical protein